MKQIICGLACCTFMMSAVFSQDGSSSDHKKHVAFKFAPASLAAGKVSVGGEYNAWHRNSVTIMAGIPFDQTQQLTFDGKQNNIQSSAFSLMAGYRHYLGKKTMSGIYLEPYAKYLTHKANGLLDADFSGRTVTFDSHSSYEGMGIGVQAGVQFVIARCVVFDLFLVGPEANSAKFSSTSVDITNNIGWSYADETEAENDIKDVLKNIPVVGNQVKVKVDKETKTITSAFSGFAPGFRIGASIGVRL